MNAASPPFRDPLRLPEPPARINHSRVAVTRGVIETQRAISHDTWALEVRAPASVTVACHARAGQFAALRFPGIAQSRPYSFAADPRQGEPGCFTFFIRCVPQGEVSDWLAGGDRSGTEIELALPLGRFVLDRSANEMLCIAGGSGMSAIKAILEEAAAARVPRHCRFYYGARTQADLYGAEAMAAVAAAWHPDYRFEFTQVLSDEPVGSDWRGARGLVTDHVRVHAIEVPAFSAATTSVFFCGPPPMIEAGAVVLEAAGVPARQIYRDVFEDARSPAPVIDNMKCVLCDECLLVKPVASCIVETAGLADGGSGYRPLEPAYSSGLYYNQLYIDPHACIRCYACVAACPHDAIAPHNSPGANLRDPLPATSR